MASRTPARIRKVRSAAALAFIYSLLVLGSSPARGSGIVPPVPDSYKVTFFDIGTSAVASGAGYGGAGFSGGAGDNTVRVINTTSANGDLCAMIYVLDDREELQTCCGCPVTPDGMQTLSVVNDLTLRFGVNKANLTAGVIKIISSTFNFTPGNPPPAPLPPGTNGASAGNSPLACSPTGIASNDSRATAVKPTAGLRAWITHDEFLEPGELKGGQSVQSPSADEFLDAPLDPTELSDLQHQCANLITGGSGVGTCTCGPTPPPPPPPPTPTPSPTPTPVPGMSSLVGADDVQGGNPWTVAAPGLVHATTGNTDFVVVALSIPASSVSWTAPSTPGGWTQFSGSPGQETGYSFAAFWHLVNSSESGTVPSYTFTSSDTTDGGEILAAIYHNTCASNTTGACSDPISASESLAVTTATAAGAFPSSGTGSLTNPSSGMPVVLAGAASGFANDGNFDQLTLSGSPALTQRGGAQEFCGVEEFDSSHGIAGGAAGPYTVHIANYVNGTSHAQGGQVFFTLSPRTN